MLEFDIDGAIQHTIGVCFVLGQVRRCDGVSEKQQLSGERINFRLSGHPAVKASIEIVDAGGTEVVRVELIRQPGFSQGKQPVDMVEHTDIAVIGRRVERVDRLRATLQQRGLHIAIGIPTGSAIA